MEHNINYRKETCQSTGTPLHAPKFGKLWSKMVENSWQVFAHSLNFLIGGHWCTGRAHAGLCHTSSCHIYC